MHPKLIQIMRSIEDRKLDEAKILLRNILAIDYYQYSNEDMQHALFLLTYIHCLEKNYKEAHASCLMIDDKNLPEKSILLTVLLSEMTGAESIIRNKLAIPGSYPNGKNLITSLAMPVHSTIPPNADHIISKNWKAFFENDEFWKVPLINSLMQLGFHVTPKDNNEIALSQNKKIIMVDKILSVAREHKIPFYLLCQDLATLPNICCPSIVPLEIVVPSIAATTDSTPQKASRPSLLTMVLSPNTSNSVTASSPAAISNPATTSSFTTKSSPVASSGVTALSSPPAISNVAVISSPAATSSSMRSDEPRIINIGPPREINANNITFKRCTAENNRLAVIIFLELGMKDSADDSFECIPRVPEPTAIEIAAYFGRLHCLSLLIKTTPTSEYLDRALKRALRNNQFDCIDMLLKSDISFKVKADMYVYVHDNKNEKNKKYLDLLLQCGINLYDAIYYQHEYLVKCLEKGVGNETIEEKENIILLATERGYSCCLNESIFRNINQVIIENALIIAVRQGIIPCLAILLGQRIQVRVKVSAFFEAQTCQNDTAQLLILQSLDVEGKRAVLMTAAKRGEVLCLNKLLPNRDITLDCKIRVLNEAIDHGQIDFVFALFNFDISESYRVQAVKRIVQTKNPRSIQRLIVYGLNDHNILQVLIPLGMPSKSNLTVLHTLTAKNKIDSLKLLLDNGFDLNAMSSCDENKIYYCSGTALMVAAHCAHLGCLSELLDRGAEIGIQLQLPRAGRFLFQRDNNSVINDYNGYTALHFAANNNGLTLLLRARQFRPSMLLLVCGNGDTVLHTAVRANNAKNILVLIDVGASPYIRNGQGDSAMLLAVRLGHQDAFNVLQTRRISFKENQTATLMEIFNYALTNKNLEQIRLSLICLFSPKIFWEHKQKNTELFHKLIKQFVETNNVDCLKIIQPFFLEHEPDTEELSGDLLENMVGIFNFNKSYAALIEFALKNQYWECAKILLEQYVTPELKKSVEAMEIKQALCKLLHAHDLKELLCLIPTPSVITTYNRKAASSASPSATKKN